MNLPDLYKSVVEAMPEAKVPGLGLTSRSWWLMRGDDDDIPDEWAELLITAHWQNLIAAKVPTMCFLPGKNTAQLNDYSIGWQFVGPTYPEALAAAVREVYAKENP